MATLDYATLSENIQTTPRSIDFVTRFGMNWQSLMDILGVVRPIKKIPGTVLKSKRARITLNEAVVPEGDVIPLSEAFVEEIPYAEMSLEKKKKQVSAEAIKDHGYNVAVAMTDEAFLYELQNLIMGRAYSYLNKGELGYAASSWQMALAMAKGLVLNKWKKMNRSVTDVVGFANILDLYEYFGAANVTIQTQFGLSYIQNFMGYRTVILLSDDEIARGRVIATPIENIVLYYVDASDPDFARADLVYTTDGVTNLIGFATKGDYDRAASNCYAIMGIVLFAEYIDGIAVADIGSSLGTVTATTKAGTAASGDTVIHVTSTPAPGNKLYYKSASGTAPAAPTFGAQFDSTGWKDITAATETAGLLVNGDTNGYKFRIVEVNGAGQAVGTGDGTVVAKA